MLYNKQVHVLFGKTVADFNGNFVFPIEKEDIDIMHNALKTNESVFTAVEEVLCSSQKVTTGEGPPSEVVNFGTPSEAKFFALDAFDDAEFSNRRFDLGFGAAGLDQLGNVAAANFEKGKFSWKKMNYFSLLCTDIDYQWR